MSSICVDVADDDDDDDDDANDDDDDVDDLIGLNFQFGRKTMTGEIFSEINFAPLSSQEKPPSEIIIPIPTL